MKTKIYTGVRSVCVASRRTLSHIAGCICFVVGMLGWDSTHYFCGDLRKVSKTEMQRKVKWQEDGDPSDFNAPTGLHDMHFRPGLKRAIEEADPGTGANASTSTANKGSRASGDSRGNKHQKRDTPDPVEANSGGQSIHPPPLACQSWNCAAPD